jgi:hypothetical protein
MASSLLDCRFLLSLTLMLDWDSGAGVFGTGMPEGLVGGGRELRLPLVPVRLGVFLNDPVCDMFFFVG